LVGFVAAASCGRGQPSLPRLHDVAGNGNLQARIQCSLYAVLLAHRAPYSIEILERHWPRNTNLAVIRCAFLGVLYGKMASGTETWTAPSPLAGIQARNDQLDRSAGKEEFPL
jgi:hypothetical protein